MGEEAGNREPLMTEPIRMTQRVSTRARREWRSWTANQPGNFGLLNSDLA